MTPTPRAQTPIDRATEADPGAGVARYTGGAEEWDRFVRARPGWTHFHLYGWKDVIERAFGHECIYLASYDGSGELEGVLPLVRVKSVLFGHFLVSLPFLNYGGPLGTDEAVRGLAAQAVARAERDGAKLLELRSRGPLELELEAWREKVTVLLDLTPEEPDRLWRELKGKVRNQVRRPLKEGAVVRFGPDQVPAFYEVFARNMRDLGTPVQSRRLFEAIADRFPDGSRFACVYLDETPVAAGCGFRWADEFEITWASSLKEYNRLAPNMLLYWSLMEKAMEDGLKTFNFGRCTPGGGTHRFKLQWGGRDEPLWWYRHPASEGATGPSQESGVAARASDLWRHLPLAAANLLGPRIVRYIP